MLLDWSPYDHGTGLLQDNPITPHRGQALMLHSALLSPLEPSDRDFKRLSQVNVAFWKFIARVAKVLVLYRS